LRCVFERAKEKKAVSEVRVYLLESGSEWIFSENYPFIVKFMEDFEARLSKQTNQP